MSYVFEPPPPTAVPVHGTAQLFPVRRVFCVGRNYAAHGREMGGDPDREPPFFFTKWADTVVPGPATIAYPSVTQNYHFEAELVVAIGRAGRAVSADAALDLVFGYAAGLDMTRRDLQKAARDLGRPWDTAKNVDGSGPLGCLHGVAEVGHLAGGRISLEQNGARRQEADLSEMIWPVADTIAFLSALYPLAPGDLIFTGTPAGVGPVRPGDRLHVEIEGLSPLEVAIGEPL